MAFELGPRRGVFIDISELLKKKGGPLAAEEVAHRETFDLIYRSLCAILYNYVPMSGHPGGSISSGRFVATALFRTMDYDPCDPERPDADLMSYAAGHKALGLYAMWALRNEVLRIGAAELLPKNERHQLRLEDLLGFRRNPTTETPLFRKLRSKALDGHPTPATPFVKLSTGASGVGVPSSLGLAYGARDTYGDGAPRVHIIEGEGGMTPGRVSEALAAAATASLDNAIMHLDWNQASIDSNRVCRDGAEPGEYVQWDPVEFAYLHDWNVILVPDGFDLQQIAAAQQQALTLDTGQPTAIIYRTVKGWKYGIEGRLSHGAGHKLCSPEFFTALKPFTERWKIDLPNCLNRDPRCKGSDAPAVHEECFWETLQCVRRVLESETEVVASFAGGLSSARKRLDGFARKPRQGAPQLERAFEEAARVSDSTPEELQLEPGAATTLRGALGKALGYYNRKSGGALLAAAADLLGSTSVNASAKGFPDGYYHTTKNPDARILSIGGICEDAISGILSGLSAYGNHIGIGSSYAAFIAPLGHIATRLHAIGNQARQEVAEGPYRTMILICAHAGVKTGEDGPTHADPQPLQLLQEPFPRGTMITLTPWDPQEVWYLLSAALTKRPAIIAPFVTRPNEKVLDRAALGLAPAHAAAKGIYKLRAARGEADGTLVLQGSEVAYAFVEETLPLLEKEGIDLNVYYVASAELFDALPQQERDAIFPEHLAREAMGITGFTLPTLYRWVTSERGRAASLHPFRGGHYLGSGQATMVLKEAGLGGEAQLKAIRRYVRVKVS
jgi:transketolase